MNEYTLKDLEFDLDQIPVSYEGNPNLKRARVSLPYTKEHIEEYVKCSQDWLYFAEKYYYVLDIDKGMVTPKIRDYQKEMIDSYINNRYTITMAARQAGKSAAFEIFLCWTILFNKDKTIAILANKAEQARDILRKIKNAYELIPKFLQQGVKVWNTGSIKLENGCTIIAASTSSSAIRGRSISILVIDEFGHIPRNIFDNFYSSVYPTISSGYDSKVIFVSTPCGLNQFYKFWMDALDKKNKFNPIRVDWWRVPGRDDKWKEETLANIGITRFRQEYGLEFFGSIATLVEPEVVNRLKHSYPLPIPGSILKNKKWEKYFSLYEHVKSNHVYVAGVDSAKMTSDNAGDALGVQVLDVTTFPFVQVATLFVKSGVSYLQAPEIIANIGTYFNNAILFVENNEIGQEVANMIQFDCEYENIYFEKANLAGFRTTKKTKRLGCSNLKLLLENDNLVLNDFDTISQLSTFIRVKESYKAESGYSDDLIMSLIAGLYFIQSQGLDISVIEDKTKFTNNIFNIKSENQNIDDEIPLMGFIPDSYDSEYEARDFDGFLI